MWKILILVALLSSVTYVACDSQSSLVERWADKTNDDLRKTSHATVALDTAWKLFGSKDTNKVDYTKSMIIHLKMTRSSKVIKALAEAYRVFDSNFILVNASAQKFLKDLDRDCNKYLNNKFLKESSSSVKPSPVAVKGSLEYAQAVRLNCEFLSEYNREKLYEGLVRYRNEPTFYEKLDMFLFD